MEDDEDNYFVESITEQLSLILWACLSTLTAVGIILSLAL